MLDRQVELVEDGERMIERGTMCGEPFERELMEWQKIDRRLRSYHAKRSALDAAEAFDLVRAEELKLVARVAVALTTTTTTSPMPT